jgi:hypothetical protein
MPVTGVASSLGISADHMRQILRHHPLPMPLRPIRRRLYPQAQQPAPHPAQDPDATRIDLDWLREQYLTWHRTLADIAAEAGCTTAALKKFAHEHGIPVRPRGTTGYLNAVAASGHHPSQIPEPLRQALHGPQATQRLHRLLLIAQHPRSLALPGKRHRRQYPLHPGRPSRTRLRRTRHQPQAQSPDHRKPDPLGEQLCQQARDYLGLAAASPAT